MSFFTIVPLSLYREVLHVQSNLWNAVAIGTTSITVERLSLGCGPIQMFYANPAPPPSPHIDRCSGPTKPIRFASSPPDCLFTTWQLGRGPAKFSKA